METGLLHLHNLLRWVILVLLVLSVLKSYSGMKSNKTFTAGDKKIWLFTMISAHITLVLGLYQWTLGRFGLFTYIKPEGVSMMKDPTLRYFQMEHPVMMIVAIVLITLGYGMSKKSVSDADKFKKAYKYFLVALILILVSIPWPFREIGRPLFPGM
ncbi:MAG: hypothetical protein ACK5F9_08600 [Bacteroidota bacterium]|jgi:hypothetical protein|nr:hypothetical protein [Chitinophagaceae bacterium]MCE2757714.1 hypothetical protein [Chitinophagaceae bacterium]GDX43825.1 hypothetical protein LBMAG23_08020 [Bacteroidota bacterium]